MNRARLFSVIFLVASIDVLSAEVRQSVVLVQPAISEEGIACYKAIGSYFRSRNFADLAKYFDSLAKGGFGSGYLALDPYGRLVVVTNRHVITFADSAAITIFDENGTGKKIEACPIIYEDPDIDCAILLLPEGTAAAGAPLELSDSVPNDGETVWSAGYPGLFGEPSWQISRGVVSNRRVTVAAIGLPEYAVFTQHSAPIDPGNSGGPLLVGDPADSSSLRVVGINTWVVFGRQNTNFAVSLEMLKAAFHRIPSRNEFIAGSEAVREKTEKLIGILNGDEWSRFASGRYISSRMVMRSGWDVFTSVVSSEKGEKAQTWVEHFLGDSPEETLRQAIFYRVYKALHKEGRPVVLDSVEEFRDKQGSRRIRTGVAAGKAVYFFDWYEESGNWRILEAGIPAAGLRGPRKRIDAAAAPRKQRPPGGYPVGNISLLSSAGALFPIGGVSSVLTTGFSEVTSLRYQFEAKAISPYVGLRTGINYHATRGNVVSTYRLYSVPAAAVFGISPRKGSKLYYSFEIGGGVVLSHLAYQVVSAENVTTVKAILNSEASVGYIFARRYCVSANIGFSSIFFNGNPYFSISPCIGFVVRF